MLPGGSLETVSDAHPSPEIDGEIRAARVRPAISAAGGISSSSRSSSLSGEFTRLEIGQMVVGSLRQWDQEVARVRLESEPSLLAAGFQDGGHPVVDAADEVVRRCRQHDKGPHLFTRDRVASFPIAPRFQRGRGPSWRSRKADSLVWLRAIHRSRQPEGCIGASGTLPGKSAGGRPSSDFALFGLRPPVGSLHQYGITPHRRRSSDRSLVLWFSRMTSNSWVGAFHRRGSSTAGCHARRVLRRLHTVADKELSAGPNLWLRDWRIDARSRWPAGRFAHPAGAPALAALGVSLGRWCRITQTQEDGRHDLRRGARRGTT